MHQENPPARRQLHPWEKAYPPTCRWDAAIERTTIPAMVDAAAARHGDKVALVYRGVSLSFVEIRDRSLALAAHLLGCGIGPGVPVGVYLPNTAAYPIVFFALMRIGVPLVSLSPLDAPRELRFKLADTGARHLITLDDPALLSTSRQIAAEAGLRRIWVVSEADWGAGPDELASLPAEAEGTPFRPLATDAQARLPPQWPSIGVDDIAILQFTGGTTGDPKAAILSHGNLTAALDILVHWKDVIVERPGEEKVLGVLPLFHSYAMLFLLLRPWREGGCVFLHRRFDAETAISQIEREAITVFPGVPTMWVAIANHPGVEARDFSSLRFCISGGAPLPAETARRVEAIVGNRLLGGWGLTEASPVGTQIPRAAAMRPGIIGVPQPGIDLQIVALDDPVRILGDNETGELAIAGPNICRGYWNRPAENAAAFVNGYFLTGDVGYRDAAGLYFIVDRRKSLIISSGFNIYPAIVENAIYEHPDIAEALVIGVPDPLRGEAVKAFLTLKPGRPAPDLQQMRSFLGSRIGRHELPVALEIRASLPRSAAGKLLRRVLEEEEGAGAARAISGGNPDRFVS